TFTDVVKALRLSRATCHSILVTLAEAGYLYRRANKSYVIGPALIAAGKVARSHFSPIEVAREEMRLLAEQFDVRCNAVVHEKSEAVLRESLGGMSHLGWHPPIGQRTSMLVPWGGLSLAWDGDEAIAQWMAAMDLAQGSEDGKAFLAAVERARQRGYYFGVRHQGWVNEMAQAPVEQRRELTDFSLLELDDAASYPLASVIAPVRDVTGVLLILVLSGLTHAVSGAQIHERGEALKAACGRVSDFLVAAAGAAGAAGT